MWCVRLHRFRARISALRHLEPAFLQGGQVGFKRFAARRKANALRTDLNCMRPPANVVESCFSSLTGKAAKDWPKDQQKYDLIKRTESGYRFKPGSEPNFTFVQAKYMAIKPHSEIGEFERDAFTDKMHFRGQRLAAACHPGRGQGVCDVPHIKLIGEIHPNDIVQGSVGDCWLLSAISALSESLVAVMRAVTSSAAAALYSRCECLERSLCCCVSFC